MDWEEVKLFTEKDRWEHECNSWCKDDIHANTAWIPKDICNENIEESLRTMCGCVDIEYVTFQPAREAGIVCGFTVTISDALQNISREPVVLFFRFAKGIRKTCQAC